MPDALKWRIFLSLAVAAGGLATIGCGGRTSSRAVTSAEPPPVAQWERPSRMTESAPAVRLDRPDAPSTEDDTAVCRDGCEDGAGGVRVSLQPGMTLYSLARTYQVPLQTIMRANDIDDPTLIPAGTEIYIPAPGGGTAPAPAPRSGNKTPKAAAPRPGRPVEPPPPSLMGIAWPLDGRITGAFGQRGRRHHHDGIDIDGTQGEEVRAVAPGIVVRSGSEGKYGKTVVIDHGEGVTTLYAHASRLLVREGDAVEQGEAIAEVGATGNAHGTHLHFEVRRNGRPVDPLPYLKPEMMGAASR
jgi:LysM repeat protein